VVGSISFCAIASAGRSHSAASGQWELLDLCTADPKWRSRLTELLRFREILGELYLTVPDDNGHCMMLYRRLMSWSAKTSGVEP
jgi:hypothetical protein